MIFEMVNDFMISFLFVFFFPTPVFEPSFYCVTYFQFFWFFVSFKCINISTDWHFEKWLQLTRNSHASNGYDYIQFINYVLFFIETKGPFMCVSLALFRLIRFLLFLHHIGSIIFFYTPKILIKSKITYIERFLFGILFVHLRFSNCFVLFFGLSW